MKTIIEFINESKQINENDFADEIKAFNDEYKTLSKKIWDNTDSKGNDPELTRQMIELLKKRNELANKIGTDKELCGIKGFDNETPSNDDLKKSAEEKIEAFNKSYEKISKQILNNIMNNKHDPKLDEQMAKLLEYRTELITLLGKDANKKLKGIL